MSSRFQPGTPISQQKPYSKGQVEEAIRKLSASSDERKYLLVKGGEQKHRLLPLSLSRTVMITGSRRFAEHDRAKLAQEHGNRDLFMSERFVYYPDFRVAGRVGDIIDVLYASGFNTLPVGKKFAMVEETNAKLMAAGIDEHIERTGQESGTIALYSEDEDRDAVIMLYENSFDPLVDADNEVINILFPPQASVTEVNSDMIRAPILEWAESPKWMVVTEDDVVSDVKDVLREQLTSSRTSRLSVTASIPSSFEIKAVLNDVLNEEDSPLVRVGSMLVGNRKKLTLIDDAISGVENLGERSANLFELYDKIMSEESRVYRPYSYEGLDSLLHDLDKLIEVGVLEEHNFIITVLRPLIDYSV